MRRAAETLDGRRKCWPAPSLSEDSEGIRLRFPVEREGAYLMNFPCLFPRIAAVALATLSFAPILSAESDRLVVSGFEHPESVVHDTLLDLYLVSNVGSLPPSGFPGALDHNGYISRVSPEGVIVDLKWIQDGVNGATLNSPKGIWLFRRALYVADVDTLRVFDRFTGAPLRNVAMPNPFAPASLFLNDVVVDNDGVAYLTDNLNSCIFVVDPEGRASVLA